ncbi:MAG: hypothetical protein ACTSUE_25210 [Promethearchaeota archaeon]
MGFGNPSGVKNILKVRADSAWINQDMLKGNMVRDEVSFVISDLLLDVHQFGNNPKLTYDMLVRCTQNVVLRYIKAFPNLNTIVLLLDEQKYVPLGKVPTQNKRKNPLTASERAKILDGGVISKMDANLRETIEMTYSKEASVKSGKCTPFAVFFSKYIRTRELRKDLVVFIANCLMKLISSGKVPDDVRIYIDGMSPSTYYSSPDHLFKATEDEEGTPLMKRRRSTSAVETINYHEDDDKIHLSVCKLARTNKEYSLMTLTDNHPSSSLCENEEAVERMLTEKKILPLWMTKEDGDVEIFMGCRGPYQRPNMGEADIKIAYYVRRIAETLAYQMKSAGKDEDEDENGCTCYVGCWDSDVIMILLLCMKEIPPEVSHCFDVLLDTKTGGTCKEIIAFHDPVSISEKASAALDSSTSLQNSTKGNGTYSHALGRIVWKEEGEYLSDIVNIQELYRGIEHYFKELHPGVSNPIETLCVLFLLTGSDYVDSLPGVGIVKLRTTFDLGGYLCLSEAISIQSETLYSSLENIDAVKFRTKRFYIDLDEDKIKAFLNLTCRFSVPLAPLKELAGSLRNKKSKLTSEANKKEKEIKFIKEDEEGEKRRMTKKEYIEIENLEKEKVDIKLQRDFLNNFLPQERYIALADAFSKSKGSNEKLVNYIHETLGMSAEDYHDWKAVEDGFKSARKNRVIKKRKAFLRNAKTSVDKEKIGMMSDKEILTKSKKRELSDIKCSEELDATIRRIGWNIVYWTFSPFVCLRDTKHLNSMCRLDTEKHSEIIYRAEEEKVKKKAGDNRRIDEFYSLNPSGARKNTSTLQKKKSKLSLNGFTRVYETPSSQSSKKRRRVKVARSRDVFPASRVIINLSTMKAH